MNDKYSIPEHLDAPFKIMLWTLDELLALFIPIVLGFFFFDAPITGIVIGASLLFGLKKLKGEQGHYFIYSLMYWYLPVTFQFKKIPPSHIRQWVG